MDLIRIMGTETSPVILIPSNMGCERDINFLLFIYSRNDYQQ